MEIFRSWVILEGVIEKEVYVLRFKVGGNSQRGVKECFNLSRENGMCEVLEY